MRRPPPQILIISSAKGLNPRLQVVARASSRETEEKLLRAGADRVVTPYTIGGQRMALGLLQPAVNEFLNSVVFDAEKHTELGEIEVRKHTEFIGRTLRDSRLRERWGALVVATKHQGGEFILSPSTDTVLRCGDMLIRESLHEAGFLPTIPATTYSPTQSPVQYHRR
jgi:voltage-gated potassium channel